MKTNLITILAAGLLSLAASAQDYVPVISTDKSWNLISYSWTVQTWEHSFGEPVVSDGIYYSPLYIEYDNLPGQQELIGYYREDLEEQRLYYRASLNDPEYLLYDFSVEVGETVQVYTMGYVHTITITAVNEVAMGGEMRTRVDFSEGEYTSFYVEGMGSVNGVPDPSLAGVADYHPTVTCYYEGTELMWDNPNEDFECDVQQAVEVLAPALLSVFPNPATDHFFVSTEGNWTGRTLTLELVDVRGRVVFTSQLRGVENARVDLPVLASGTYTVRLLHPDGHAMQSTIVLGTR